MLLCFLRNPYLSYLVFSSNFYFVLFYLPKTTKRMSVLNKERDFSESILKETALIMLKAEEQDENFGCIGAWEYISTYLCREHDC